MQIYYSKSSLRGQHQLSAKESYQDGFSLIEVSIVTAIIMLIAIIGIPAIQAYVIENKVPRVAEEIQRFVARIKANTHGFGSTPYAGIHNGTLASALRGSSVVSVSGEGAMSNIAHGLGGLGTSGRGVVQIEAHSLAGAGRGSAFSITFTDVNEAACPALASILQRIAESVTISGRAGAAQVKNATQSPPQPYNPILADAQCSSGDSNTFQFVVR
ncbi:pilin/secretion family protein with methylation motif [Jezberella montanilacus]|uniref:Pilin/secretion family protein with methylation motif n=2 Tax=Jezberella montanilacus TaxID=323426 RepID=A0A2T0XC68_9BURK|nr:pilin/secretion family protein with methylation motif [Jezberella montanilacus]